VWGPLEWRLPVTNNTHSTCRNQNYIIQDGAAVIVDANTGRGLQGTRWEKGLHNVSHFLADACHAVTAFRQRETLSRIVRTHTHINAQWSVCGIVRNHTSGCEGNPNAVAFTPGSLVLIHALYGC
jgi:SecA preprotein cross-linking domain